MNVDIVNPFLQSLLNVLSTMAQTEATHRPPGIKRSQIATGDVTGIIGMVGNKVKGSLSISFSEQAALHITNSMLGESLEKIDETVTDMVGEITNMVTGGAKRIFSESGHDFEMATPTVIAGADHEIHHHCQGSVIQIPFDSKQGSFYVEVSFEDVK
ncbi:MAG: chemotaxis protein CheX [Gammaproteobacteria bacterium]|nr:chemotaxis protein CheX [Gammaproteobacteria bacterium]